MNLAFEGMYVLVDYIRMPADSAYIPITEWNRLDASVRYPFNACSIVVPFSFS